MNTRCNFNYLLGKILFEGVLFGKYIKRKLFHNKDRIFNDDCNVHKKKNPTLVRFD